MDVLFWSATLFFFVFEIALSYAYSDSPLMPDKGFITDIFAAATIWALSFLVYFAATAVKIDCKYYAQLSDYNENGCENYAGKIQTVGDVLNTTVTLNPIIAATISFIIIGLFLKFLNRNKT